MRADMQFRTCTLQFAHTEGLHPYNLLLRQRPFPSEHPSIYSKIYKLEYAPFARPSRCFGIELLHWGFLRGWNCRAIYPCNEDQYQVWIYPGPRSSIRCIIVSFIFLCVFLMCIMRVGAGMGDSSTSTVNGQDTCGETTIVRFIIH